MHDSIGRRLDGVQHVRPGRRAANEGDLPIFNRLRGTPYPPSVQEHPPPCCGGEGVLVGSYLRLVARPGPGVNGDLEDRTGRVDSDQTNHAIVEMRQVFSEAPHVSSLYLTQKLTLEENKSATR